ncbi:hypothetical protein D3C81_1928740 [compost metagenome]
MALRNHLLEAGRQLQMAQLAGKEQREQGAEQDDDQAIVEDRPLDDGARTRVEVARRQLALRCSMRIHCWLPCVWPAKRSVETPRSLSRTTCSLLMGRMPFSAGSAWLLTCCSASRPQARTCPA